LFCFFKVATIYKQSSAFLSNNGLSLGEVRAHVSLKIEISELIGLLELQQSLELSIRVNLATVLLVLETVGADVSVELSSDISAGHLSASGLLKELGKLVRDEGRLDKSRGGTVTRLSLLLGRNLLGSLELLGPVLLHGLELRLKGGDQRGKLAKLGGKLSGLGGHGDLNIIDNSRGSSSLNSGGNNSDSLGLDLDGLGLDNLLGSLGLGNLGLSGNNGSSSSSGSSSLSDFGGVLLYLFGHLIILYYIDFFLSSLTHNIYILF